MIFIELDRTQYPDNFQATPNPGLEQLTGADMCISKLPLPVSQSSLETHIKNHSRFIQLKNNGDNLSYDAIHNFCARVQEHKIPISQAVLLRIGRDWYESFRTGKDKYSNKQFDNYEKFIMATMGRGVTVYHDILQDIDSLPKWIENIQETDKKFEVEGTKLIFPPRLPLLFEIDNIWQLVEEEPKNTWVYFLCRGIHGVGQQTIINIQEYFRDKLLIPPSGIMVLKVLTEEDEKGNGVHKIKGWGDVSRKNLRDILLLGEGQNISVEKLGMDSSYQAGAIWILERFKILVEEKDEKGNKKRSAKEAFDISVNLAQCAIEF